MENEIIKLPQIADPRGNLSFIENNAQIPFKIKRIHWIYDVPGGAERGGVSYEKTEEFIIAMSGSFDVVLDNGYQRRVIQLNRSYNGVYIPKGIWRELQNFSTNSVAVIAASTYYDPAEGLRDYVAYKGMRQSLLCDATIEESVREIKAKVKNMVYDCNIIELDKHHSERRGNISVVENWKTIPFDVKRVYYLYDVPGGISRGGHAHKELYQLIIAASGSFMVTLDDGNVKRSYLLNRPYQGLLVKPGVWRDLNDFSSGSVCLVLASEKYDESDYIRNYDDFLKYRAND